jgi:hypothetical protein
MNKISFFKSVLVFCGILFAASVARGQEWTNIFETNTAPKRPGLHFKPGLEPTDAYRREILRRMIEQANQVARDMNLAEQLPITESNLTEAFVNPPIYFIDRGTAGNIGTSNYLYFVRRGRKMSEISHTHLDSLFVQDEKNYSWPISRLDTNAAFQVATQIMASAGADIVALNRDCKVEIRASMTEGPHGKHFVPYYWVVWRKSGSNAAFLEFLEPSRSLRDLTLDDETYNLREAMVVTNLDSLLNRTNMPAKPKMVISADDLEKIKERLKENPDLVFRKDGRNLTPLHKAAYDGQKEVVELLLANKADVNARDYRGYTPLHLAASQGQKGVVELLLAYGSDINAKAFGDTTPLDVAASGGHKDVVELLLAKGADINARGNYGWTPLKCALLESQLHSPPEGIWDVIKLLREHGAQE